MRLKLRDKILLGFGLVFVANLLALIYGTLVFISIESKAASIEKKWVPATRLVRDVTHDLQEIRSNNLGHVIFGQVEAMAVFESRRQGAVLRATANLEFLKAHLVGTRHEGRADLFGSQLLEFVRVTDQTIALSRVGDKEAARRWVQVQGTPVYDAAVTAGSDLLTEVDGEAERAAVEARSLTVRARNNLLWSAGLTLAWTILVGVVLAISLSKPLLLLTEAARRVARGELSEVKPIPVSDTGEIGLLAEAFNVMVGRIRLTQEGLEELVRRRTAELERVNQELVGADKHKSQFLAMTTHELRTPLTLILGYGEDLLDESVGSLNDKQKRCLEKVQSSARGLLSLVNELLDFSRVEAGKVRLEYSVFPAGQLLDELAEEGRALATKVGVLFSYRFAAGRPGDTLCGDRGRLGQIILNLLANATKFTPSGGEIQLVGSVEPEQLVIEVRDTGPGIDLALQTAIFEAFEQGAAPLTLKTGGFGLGLPLARRLAELHGGTLEVESQAGRGSRFTVRVPRWPFREAEADRGG